MPGESALVVLIPEAENLVEAFRLLYDPSAATGFPAHVTILYPFKSPDQLTPQVIAMLREVFANFSSFTTSFRKTQRFPDTLYLAPTSSKKFRQLTETIARVFPDTPPYGGGFAKIIPHLTVAQVSDPQQLDTIAAEFHEVAREKLPITASVKTVSLMDNGNGQWKARVHFSLR